MRLVGGNWSSDAELCIVSVFVRGCVRLHAVSGSSDVSQSLTASH